ncbi:MAG TPA: amidohydrolase [Chthoniobacterales bacterium]|nr:amidohydrolase [Chthoniobacterales bacterium]
MKILGTFLFAALCSTAMAAAENQTVFVNGNIYTMNQRQPRAEAIAVKGDRIVFVGSNADAKKYQADGARTVDLAGKTVVPGLTDSHCHIFGIGERELTLNLEGTNTLEDFLAKVKERVAKTEPGKWVTGRGWIETFWKPPQFPTRADLDKIAPNNPVWLTRADGHAAIANTAALRIAKIEKDTPNPFGGEILKDKQTGEPTGMLLDHAQELVRKNIPQPTEAERREAFVVGVKRELSLGWCEIQNAGSDLNDPPLMRQALASGDAKIRVYNAAYGPGPAAAALLRDGPILNENRFTQRTIKVVFDGALGSRGAALLAPYSDAPDTSGFLREKETDLQPMLEEALRKGIQVETHAIGDRANRVILNLYEEASKKVNGKALGDARWRVEHAQILSAQDLPRFAKLGIIASMQPSHAISDLFFAPSRLGKERLAGAYAWQSLLKSGAIICGGSDAPVERGEPMIEFYAAVTRRPLPGRSEGLSAEALAKEEWHPEQAVTREQALKMFTLAPAYAAFEEKDKGSIEPGKLADLTVLSADIMKIPEPEILKTTCAMTVVGGGIAYEANNLPNRRGAAGLRPPARAIKNYRIGESARHRFAVTKAPNAGSSWWLGVPRNQRT